MRQKTLKTFAYGHDFGNSEIAGVLLGQGWKQERQIPSVFAPGTWREVETFAGSLGKSVQDYLHFGHYVLSYVNERDQLVEKYLGQKVFDDGLSPSTTRADQERYWRNNYSLEALMVGSASCVQEQSYGLHVVTGLPIHLYTPEHARRVEAALLGSHVFTLNGRERSMVVHSVKVVAEGAGALIAYGSNDSEVIEGVIDIGGETTDLYGARGQRPIRAMCDGLSRGVAAAADLFNQKFRENYGRALSLNRCMQLLRQHVNKEAYTDVRDAQRRVVQAGEIANLIETALATVGQEIATFVAQKWKEQQFEMQRALIVGGGAYYFTPSIIERLPFAKAVPRPEMANALGYATLAEAILTRARQEAAG
ncbi:MAG TPA: ParM/StbA family protein [Ktedonobacteraceae bacterium]|nr:ParM/StbA family protein [Ktedonobacteraceae bacterium]